MMRILPGMLLVCALVHGVHIGSEDVVDVNEMHGGADDQLSAVFDDEHSLPPQPEQQLGDDDQELGEAGPKQGVQTLAAASQHQEFPDKSHNHVSFQFKQMAQKLQRLSAQKQPVGGSVTRAREMIQLGTYLEELRSRRKSHRLGAVQSLQEALQTKLLMDELKPEYGSLTGGSKAAKELGEEHVHTPMSTTAFGKMLSRAAASKADENMNAITKYLLERKKEGRPLTSAEDEQLQNFYYNRASTILKKIVLLKRGDEPAPEENMTEEAHDISHPETRAELDAEDKVRRARDHARAVVERLRFDAKVASANAQFNRKMLQNKERRMKAATEERRQAEKQQLKAAKEKLLYDQKVQDAEEKYNERLSTELLQRKKVAEARVQKAAVQKHAADVAAAQATQAANEADKEAKQAELEAQEATKHAEELEAKQQAKDMEKKHRTRAHSSSPLPTPKAAEVPIPIDVVPRAHLASLLRYLRSALDRHLTITVPEQQLMQSFFLKRGSALLSQLAEVDPDATWHSQGVVREEQYEMDRGMADQLSSEWGSKNLKDDTVIRDFVSDALWAKKSTTGLARPDNHQAIEGLFGSNHKVPLKFAPDASQPETSEPDLGESEGVEEDAERAQQGAMTAMMGIGMGR